MPAIHQIEKWWHAEDLRSLALLLACIRKSGARRPILDLLELAFCRVMISFAHVSFGHQSMSFRKRRKERLLFSDTPSVPEAFGHAVRDIAGTLAEKPRSRRCKIYLGDSRLLQEVLPEGDYTCVITSPPYPNRMSYIRELRPYMYWLGYLSNGREAGELDWRAIGGTWGCATSLLKDWEPGSAAAVPYPGFRRIVSAVANRHSLLGPYIHKYFVDMRQHIESLSGVLASGARCYYVVGNSKFYDTMLPTQDILAHLFSTHGFRAVHVSVLRKRTSKRELYEYVVEAQKR